MCTITAATTCECAWSDRASIEKDARSLNWGLITQLVATTLGSGCEVDRGGSDESSEVIINFDRDSRPAL